MPDEQKRLFDEGLKKQTTLEGSIASVTSTEAERLKKKQEEEKEREKQKEKVKQVKESALGMFGATLDQMRLDAFINQTVDEILDKTSEELDKALDEAKKEQEIQTPQTPQELEDTVTTAIKKVESEVPLPVNVISNEELFPLLEQKFKPFEYQVEAVNDFREYRHATIVLPTGAGKTLVGAMVIKEYGIPAIVITPQIQIMNQWADLFRQLGSEPSLYFGEQKIITPLTITTYQSATQHPEIMESFRVVIFDEVHHAYADEYSKLLDIAREKEIVLGLTATPLKPQDKGYLRQEDELPVAYVLTPVGLSTYGRALIPVWEYVSVNDSRVSSIEKTIQDIMGRIAGNYDSVRDIYDAVKLQNPSDKDIKIQALVYMKLANERKKLLSGTVPKIIVTVDKINRILTMNPDSKIIVFTESATSANDISRALITMFDIPTLVLLSEKGLSADEKRIEMEKLKRGEYKVLVGVDMIVEGLDVPDMDVAIFVSTTVKSQRRFTQKMGRILRYKEGKHPKAITIAYANTSEGDNASARMYSTLQKSTPDEIEEITQSDLDAMRDQLQQLSDSVGAGIDFKEDKLLEEIDRDVSSKARTYLR